MTALHETAAVDLVNQLRRGEVGPVELVTHYLERVDRLDRQVGAFITVTADAALEHARRLERAGRPADPPPLWGLPLADKDLVARGGVRTTYGSRVFVDSVPEHSDPSARMVDEAGAISLGKTNTSEFGLAGYTEPDPEIAPPARSPWRLSLGAGGSSGGAAAAVSAGLLPVAIGSDGGGSVRIPAASTGLVGLKPSRGRVPSGSGFLSLGGMSVHGPLARSVADAALLFEVMTEGALASATVAPGEGGGWLAATESESRFRIAAMTTSPWDEWTDIRLAPEVRASFDTTVAALVGLGHDVGEHTLRDTAAYPRAFHTVWQASAANIAVEGAQLDELAPLTRWLVLAGRGRTARELADALRRFAEFERDLVAQFAPWDAVLTPTLAELPPAVGRFDEADGERNFRHQVQVMPYTSMVNVAGLPAISLPVDLTADGVPVGMQLIGRPGGERTLLAIAGQLERRIGWQHRHPPLW